MSHVLVVTSPDDAHSFAVAEALRRKGAAVRLWFTTDFPGTQHATIAFEGDGPSWSVSGSGLSLESRDPPAVVWFRRPSAPVVPAGLAAEDRRVAQDECLLFARALWRTVAPDALWVNAPDASVRANLRPLQHRAALESGLEAPETLYTNDPRRIRAFLARHGGRAVYKMLGARAEWNEAGRRSQVFASPITEADLPPDDVLAATPGIFQPVVPKAHELRVTAIGRRLFTARLRDAGGELDWRLAREQRWERAEIPEATAAACRALLDRLGLAFGCFDFVVTPEGKLVFLEVNEMGQFLFVEEETGLPLLDAFAELLRQGRLDYEWDESKVSVRFGEVADVMMRERARALDERR